MKYLLHAALKKHKEEQEERHKAKEERRLEVTAMLAVPIARRILAQLSDEVAPTLRLRQWLRHERLSVALALADYNHHGAPRRPTMARAREGEERVVLHGRAPETPPPLPRMASGWTTTGTCLPPGRHLSLRCGRRDVFSDTPSSTSSMGPLCTNPCCACAADGGTASGSADDPLFPRAISGHSRRCWGWFWWRSSRFSPWTGFSDCRADR